MPIHWFPGHMNSTRQAIKDRVKAGLDVVIELLDACSHPFSLITKNAAVTRDIDLLSSMAQRGLVTVYFSVTTLDNKLSSRMEPRAAAPHARLKAMRQLSDAGVPVGVMVAPVIPMINDREIEHILEAAHAAGARAASSC